MKHLYPIILCSVFLMFFALPGLYAQADDENFTPLDWDIEFDKCEGKLKIKFNLVEGEGDDTNWVNCEVKVRTPSSSSLQTVLAIAEGDDSLPIDTEWTGRDYRYGTYNIQGAVTSTPVLSYAPNTEVSLISFELTHLNENFLGGAIEVKIEGLWNGDQGDDSEIAQTKSATALALSGPTSVSATNDLCNKVEITVSGSLDCESSSGERNVLELLRGTNLDNFTVLQTHTLPSGSFGDYVYTFTDNGLQPGDEYLYQARLKYEKTATSTIYESKVNPPAGIPGKPEPLPLVPNNFKASDDDCEEKIKLTWSWAGLNPENGFAIERSLSPDFNNVSTFFAVADQRSYEDETVTPKTTYYYRVYAINHCNAWSPASSSDPGIAPSKPTAADSVKAVINPARDKIIITWNDRSNDETGFIVERSLQGGAGVATFPVDENVTSFQDDQIVPCQTYVYKVKAVNDCGEENSINQASIRLEPDLSNTFDDSSFEVAKGYFNNRVELSWTPAANDNLIGFYKIFRRPLGSVDTFTQIQVVTGQTNIYNDVLADAGVLYEYKIRGESDCENTTLTSNEVSAIGFRSASGIVSGQITYTGNIAVKGAKVIVERSGSASVGRSLGLDGVSDYASFPDDTLLRPDTMTLETWVRPGPAISGDGTILQKMDGASGYALRYIHATQGARFEVYDNTGALQTLEVDNALPSGQYTHLSARISTDSIKLFINGVARDSAAFSGPVKHATVPLIMGKNRANAHFFKGQIDETRIWSIPRAQELIERDFNRILNPDEPGLVATWSYDEGLGVGVYDRSKSGTLFNKQHGELHGGAIWSIDIPDEDQLSLYGITDDSGNYTISNIRYAGSGESFSLTPVLGTHAFEPSVLNVFMGDGSNVLNNQNFKDISSFKVTGEVFYKGTTCPAKDILLKIDGEVVVSNGEPITTNDQGLFEIQVPIGKHRVSVEKPGHGFSVGRWPTNGDLYDFQAPVSGIEFKDSTEIIVVGRMVGGTREGNKKPGLGRSKNNIGQAQIIFTATAGSGCIVDTVLTDAQTGEYRTVLPPLNYNITELKVLNQNQNITTNDFGVLPQLMLSQNPPLKTIRDTVYVADTTQTIERIDSVSFHKLQNFIYRNTAQLDVFLDDGTTPFKGASSIVSTDADENDETIDLETNMLPFPVFQRGEEYKALVKAFERYRNYDNNAPVTVDDVPVMDGTLIIQNNLALQPGLSVPVSDGDTLITFVAGKPNNVTNSTTPAYSFTKTFEITLQRPGQTEDVKWEPNAGATFNERVFRAYVIGGRAVGNNFTTRGPNVVDFVIRDPSGSGSKAFLKQDSVYTTNKDIRVNFGEEASYTKKVMLGTKFTVGIGYQTSSEIYNTLSGTIKQTLKSDNTFGLVETWSFSSTLGTNAAAEAIGARSDLYVGKSMNIIFGISENIEVLPDSVCNLSGVDCVGDNSTPYQIGRRKGLFIVPDNNETQFVYDQTTIEELLIPNLKALRNSMFVNNPSVYQTSLNANDPRYGTNNDDPVWGALASTPDSSSTTDPQDKSGPSYTWTGQDSVYSVATDSIRWLNQQIRLWENAIRDNEEDKVKSMADPTNLTQNISFSAGATISRQETTSSQSSLTRSVEVGLSTTAALEVGTEIAGTGFSVDASLKLDLGSGYTNSSSTTTSTTWGYDLFDGDQGDLQTVNIYKSKRGWGPIFETVAGQTSCPHEDQIVTQYYQPGTQLSARTLQREKPEIGISPTLIQNVPADEEAVFNLTLTSNNESTEGESAFKFGLKVLDGANPDGAQVLIDGQNPNLLLVTIPSQSSITKTLTVRRGPVKYDYDSLKLIIYSLCQFTSGTSFEVDIVDTVTFSVHFIPTCTRVNLDQPDDQWVLNTFFNDTLPIVMDEYNINYPNFERVSLQYKPAAVSTWTELESFWHPSYVDSNYNNYLSTSTAFTRYNWDMSQIVDGDYNLRAVSVCELADKDSEILSGHADRVNPRPFGTPSPGDGILDPNDDIMIQFNEVIDEGSLTFANFDIRGVLNGTDLRHQESVSFNGVNNYAQIPQGYQLNLRSFAVEFWAKRNGTGEACLFAQGTSGLQSIFIGFDANDKFSMTIAGQTIATSESYTDTDWHHYTVSYDHNNQEAKIMVDGVVKQTDNAFFASYRTAGPILIGKSSADAERHFNGFIHELRLWNIPRTLAGVAQHMNKTLSGREAGLIGNWPMDEAIGDIAFDKVRNRHATLYADWSILPVGRSIQLNGTSDYLQANTGTLVFTDETDFTIEFWFKGNSVANQTLFSNGKGDGTDSNETGWSISTDANGAFVVRNNGQTFQATNTGYWDDNWHHFALVVRRLSTISCYIDAELQNTGDGDNWNGLGAANLWLGCRGWYDGSQIMRDQFFGGQLDEVRIWNTARRQEQIARDRVNRMIGDEFGLRAYYPFEHYEDNAGVAILTPTLHDESVDTLHLTVPADTNFIQQTPPIKLQRPVEKVNFTYTINQDKIILTPTDPSGRIENVTLDITVKRVKDLYGNYMQSPATWIAYIDKNQVVWEDQELNFEKLYNEPLSFSANILNTGGSLEAFNINNLPPWLTATPSSGAIEPNSQKTIQFEVNPGVNSGVYEQDLYLRTDFGYNEKLLLNLKVYHEPPDWSVDPTQFEYNMSIIGAIRIDGVISTDDEDQIAAFVNGDLRGSGSLQYLPSIDRYLVFLDVYSNLSSGEKLEFQVWNADEGQIHTDVIPTINFIADGSIGSLVTPQIFDARSTFIQNYDFRSGWNWISFPLESDTLQNTSHLFWNLDASDGDVINSQSYFDQYSTSFGWHGALTLSGGMNITEGYKLRLTNADDFYYIGRKVDPDTVKMVIEAGWNWIGLISRGNLEINDALATLNPTNGDLIKSQYAFAVYDDNLGWLGSLEYMEPTRGYMIKSAAKDTLVYPRSGIFGLGGLEEEEKNLQDSLVYALLDFYPETYPETMSIIAEVENCFTDEKAEQLYLIAYAGDEARGVARLQYLSAGETWKAYLTTFGIQDEDLTFRVFDLEVQQSFDLEEGLAFVPNRLEGTLDEAAFFHFAGGCDAVVTEVVQQSFGRANHVLISPNPSASAVYLTINLEGNQNTQVVIRDLNGRIVAVPELKHRTSQQLLLEWDGRGVNGQVVSAGIYFVEVVSGDYRFTGKLIRL